MFNKTIDEKRQFLPSFHGRLNTCTRQCQIVDTGLCLQCSYESYQMRHKLVRLKTVQSQDKWGKFQGNQYLDS